MRSQQKVFDKQLTKDSKLKEIYGNILSYSEKEIKNLKSYRPWIKKLLVKEHKKQNYQKITGIILLSTEEQYKKSFHYTPTDIKYKVYRWTGKGEWIKSIHNTISINIEPNDLLLEIDKTYILNTTYVNISEEKKLNLEFIGDYTIHEYKVLYQKYLCEKYNLPYEEPVTQESEPIEERMVLGAKVAMCITSKDFK